MKVAIFTLGCKVNQYESQVICELLEKGGFTVVDSDETADIYIVNSCTVTSESDRKNRQAVRRFKRRNPDSIVVLTGCMPQAYPDDCKKLNEADIVLGNRSNHLIVEAINEYLQKNERCILTSEHKTGDEFVPCRINSFRARTRAEIKIEDGCNRFCSYCAIPYARGRVRSKKISDIREESKALAEAGFCEIVLVGINLSAYRDGENDLCDAIKAASESDGILRVRLGSLEPNYLTDSIIERMAECKKLCPQFHISLQSGCDKTLKAMNRHYTSEEYYRICKKIREVFDGASVTTDVMTGFPGETDTDFEESLEFVKKIGFEKVHVFPYSVRTGTKAASMDGQNEKSVKEARAKVMSEETEKIRKDFLKKQIGKTLSVLIEELRDGAYHEGFTANYTPVKVFGECPDSGIVNVRITDTDDESCIGNAI
ncbi:MAG: tRNA (N(6)-L-threonylcarbamoyladenosine(37)-C(2))-methylthiotransferase MtaB [Clostridia bacterium]|nr:tRNA (N(6)-L-threonylcarbamoyladenosine(37)-C(2))-methylthiotransferase MtaB [Clostridia bacterium]